MTSDLGVDIVSLAPPRMAAGAPRRLSFSTLKWPPRLRSSASGQPICFSKSRFIAAQFDAYFENGLWLDTARHANAMAARLQAGIENADHARLGWQSPANETFPIVSKALANDARRERGHVLRMVARHAPHPHLVGPGETMLRLVTSFATTEDHVDQFVDRWAKAAQSLAESPLAKTTNTITTVSRPSDAG
jgi:threonine aldolase